MSVSLSEVKRAARAHRAPLAGESAGYLVLALADQVLTAPRIVTASDVRLGEDGGLRIVRGEASSDGAAEQALRQTLDELLLVASSGSAALMRAGRRAPTGLAALVKELEAALIPVNRAAAKRALSRLHRETARAVESGQLPEELPEVAAAVAPVAVAPVVVAPVVVAPVVVAVAPVMAPEPVMAAEPAVEPEASVDLEPWLPPALSNIDDVVTIALDVAAVSEHELTDDELEIVEEEEPTRAIDLPVEACTKPEPVIVRKALRPLVPEILPLPASPLHTPALGSLARELPVLTRERIAELSAIEEEEHATHVFAPVAPIECEIVTSASEPSPCSPLIDECTEPMPEVEPLTHGVSIVATRKSDVSELLAGFRVDTDDAHQGLCRAIKEMAELDLTPAPFTALIR